MFSLKHPKLVIVIALLIVVATVYPVTKAWKRVHAIA